MARRRNRIGETGAEELLKETIEAGLKLKAFLHDGHTLTEALSRVERIAAARRHVFMDMGYRGHGSTGDVQVHVDKRRRGRTPPSLRHRVKRRAAIEPEIGHLKREHRINHNRLKGIEGDRIDAILCAAGMNFRKPQRFAAAFFFALIAPAVLRRLSLVLLPLWLSKIQSLNPQSEKRSFSGSTTIVSAVIRPEVKNILYTYIKKKKGPGDFGLEK